MQKIRRVRCAVYECVSLDPSVSPVGTGYTSSRRVKVKQLQAWSGPEGSRKLRFPDFMTTAQDVSKVVGLRHRPPLPPRNTSGTHFC